MLDISPESLIGGYAVEIEGRCFVKIRGGGSILLYTPTEIRVSLSKKREFISVCAEENCRMVAPNSYSSFFAR